MMGWLGTVDQHSNDGMCLLFGLAGWPHPEWQDNYFPGDLPPDWQLGFYSNDADCLLLTAQQWLALDADDLVEWLDDVPEHFRFYLEWSEDLGASPIAKVLGNHLGGVLVKQFEEKASVWPQFCQKKPQHWIDRGGVERIQVWAELPSDLRQQRALLEQLPPTLEALLIADPASDPGKLSDTRKVAQLLGIA